MYVCEVVVEKPSGIVAKDPEPKAFVRAESVMRRLLRGVVVVVGLVPGRLFSGFGSTASERRCLKRSHSA